MPLTAGAAGACAQVSAVTRTGDRCVTGVASRAAVVSDIGAAGTATAGIGIPVTDEGGVAAVAPGAAAVLMCPQADSTDTVQILRTAWGFLCPAETGRRNAPYRLQGSGYGCAGTVAVRLRYALRTPPVAGKTPVRTDSLATPTGRGGRIAGMSFGGLQTATAFWSYAHSDDEGSDGQIRRLKENLDNAFKMHRGEALASFFDRTGEHKLEWGEEWRSKISTTISGTTFFIPVISPTYLKSPICREEFDEFTEKAKDSDLNELILPILWVPVDPETDEERRIFDTAKARQWVDWTARRKLDEASAEYKALIDEMGERLAKAAKSVATKPEVTDAKPGSGEADPADDSGGTAAKGGGDAIPSDGYASTPSPTDSGPPGLVDLAADATSQVEAFAAHLTTGFQALHTMFAEVLTPNPMSPKASAGQRQFYFKRIAKEMAPFVAEFERSVKEAEDDARRLNDTMFMVVESLQEPTMRGAVDIQNIGRVKEIPAVLAEKFGNYGQYREQISAVGRMSRDLRAPFSAIDRAFDSLDEIMALVQDWTTAIDSLEGDPALPNPPFSSPATQTD